MARTTPNYKTKFAVLLVLPNEAEADWIANHLLEAKKGVLASCDHLTDFQRSLAEVEDISVERIEQ